MGAKLHKLLERQLSALGLSANTLPNTQEAWCSLLVKVAKAYEEGDQNRYLLQRSIDVTSKEMLKRWEKVKSLEEQWHSLGECVPDLVMMLDLQGKIVFSNRTKGSFTKEELIGKPLWALYAESQTKNIQELIHASISLKCAGAIDIEQAFDSSEESFYSLRANPIMKFGQVIGLVAMETNISEIRKATLDREARKRAEMAVETKGRFLANMSHEIRTPLNGILGLTSLLLGQARDQDSLRKLETIQRCGETLLSLVNDILDFSKLEAGKVVLDVYGFDLHQAVAEMVDLLTPKALEKKLAISLEIDPSVPLWVRADGTKLRQVLFNLVGNAVKFTEVGRITLKISCVQEAGQQVQIQFRVTDTGPGIGEELQQRLFQSFSQIDAGTTRRYGGTGLGLSICKGLVEAMGGRIGVQSQVGKGSTFYFHIQAARAEKPPEQEELKADQLLIPRGAGFSFEILLAEDNAVNRMVVIGFLKQLGFSVDTAENGLQALERMKQKRYDLVLMDCHMPEMDGFQAAREICRLWPNERPTIVAVTASTLQEDIRRCHEAGMEAVLGKPIVRAKLAEMIRSAVLKRMAMQPKKVA